MRRLCAAGKRAVKRDNLQFVNGVQARESQPFAPQSPGKAKYVSPANASVGSPAALVFNGGYFGVYADVHFGTSSNPPLYQANVPLSANAQKSVPLPVLAPGTTYYWKVVNKTFANMTSIDPIYSFVAQ